MKFSFLKRQSLEKKFEKSLSEYLKAAESSPNDIRIHTKIAELYLENNKKNKAIEEYLYAAKAYSEKRLFQIAIAIYNHILSLDPNQVEVYCTLANLHLKNGFIGDAVAVLEKLANYYYEQGMKYEAIDVLKKITEIDPKNEFFKIKVAKFYQGKDLKHEETLLQGPKDKWELIEQTKVEKTSNAEEQESNFFDLESALQKDPSINISIISEEQAPMQSKPSEEEELNNKFDGIFEELKAGIESTQSQNSPLFHFNLGIAYKRLNQLEGAVDEFEKALEQYDKKYECYLQLAICNRALKRIDRAEQYVQEALALDSLTAEEKLNLHYELGLIYKAKGDRDNALKTFKNIFEANKNFKSVFNEIQELS